MKGVAAILAEDPREGATDNWPTFARNPRIACKDRRTRVHVLRGLQAWRAEVRTKRERWRRGEREVVFPRGTYGIGVLHGARVEGVVRPGAEPSSAPRPPPHAA